jgi:RNA polymerase sigma-70 factor (ECF subfamily)
MATSTAPGFKIAGVSYRGEPAKHSEKQPFDQQYVDRLMQGETETCVHFSRYFTKLLVVKLRSKLRDNSQAEDVAQETLLRVFKYFRDKGSLENPERLGAWVNSFCDNIALEFFRAGNRFQQAPENVPEPVCQAMNAEFNCINAQRKTRLAGALRKLDNKDRIIIEKVFLQEQDKDNICRELGINRNHLRLKVHRALGRFRKVLETDRTM